MKVYAMRRIELAALVIILFVVLIAHMYSLSYSSRIPTPQDPEPPRRRYPPPDEYRQLVDAALAIGDEAEARRLMDHADSLDIIVDYLSPAAKTLQEKRLLEWHEQWEKEQKQIEKR